MSWREPQLPARSKDRPGADSDFERWFFDPPQVRRATRPIPKGVARIESISGIIHPDKAGTYVVG